MRFLVLLLLAGVFPLLVILSLSDSAEEQAVEWELAVVNSERRVPADHPTVSQFGYLLDRLEENCTNSRREIAEVCIAVHNLRKRRGSSQTLLEFTTELEEAVMMNRGSGEEVDLRVVVEPMLEDR